MTEKIIELEDIDLAVFYGVDNANINRIVERVPHLKIVARGGRIKVFGSQADMEDFERRVKSLIEYHNKFGHISPEVVDQVFCARGVVSEPVAAVDADVILFGNNGLVVRARTVNQQKMVSLYDSCDLLLAVGPAGTGKTYTAIALAVKALKNKEVKRIILTRPAVEAGEKLGFLPGDMKDKLDPYLQPLYDALHDMIPASKLAGYMSDGTVQIAPLAYMRGRTLDNAFVILDEAQNTTTSQLKMFLTRMGRSAKFIVTGDMTQVDLPRSADSGLPVVLSILKDIDGIGVVEFDSRDIIRHKLVKHIVGAFDRYAAQKGHQSESQETLSEE